VRITAPGLLIVNFRRYYIPDSQLFITQVAYQRRPYFREPAHLDLLLATLRNVKQLHPFQMLGYVFLPDHFHLLIRPTGSSSFSHIMHSLKQNFTAQFKRGTGVGSPTHVWQQRFWDHIIRDELDLQRHLDYIHYNPVKHRYVSRPEDWPASSYGHWKARGFYPDEWGTVEPQTLAQQAPANMGE
jgi:putative transposase